MKQESKMEKLQKLDLSLYNYIKTSKKDVDGQLIICWYFNLHMPDESSIKSGKPFFLSNTEGLGITLPEATEEKIKSITINLVKFDLLVKNLGKIWVVGKYKTGKSWLISHLLGVEIKTEGEVLKTTGEVLYLTKNWLIVDTEGFFQPIGIDNPHLRRDIIIGHMNRCSDVQIMLYGRLTTFETKHFHQTIEDFQSINKDIGALIMVHNIKDITTYENLQEYIRFVKNEVESYGLKTEDEALSLNPPSPANKGELEDMRWGFKQTKDQCRSVEHVFFGDEKTRDSRLAKLHISAWRFIESKCYSVTPTSRSYILNLCMSIKESVMMHYQFSELNLKIGELTIHPSMNKISPIESASKKITITSQFFKYFMDKVPPIESKESDHSFTNVLKTLDPQESYIVLRLTAGLSITHMTLTQRQLLIITGEYDDDFEPKKFMISIPINYRITTKFGAKGIKSFRFENGVMILMIPSDYSRDVIKTLGLKSLNPRKRASQVTVKPLEEDVQFEIRITIDKIWEQATLTSEYRSKLEFKGFE